MASEPPPEGAGSTTGDAAHPIPPLAGAARLRYVMAAVAAFLVPAFLTLGIFQSGQYLEPPIGQLARAALVVVPVWLPSLCIAKGLSRGRIGAVRGALIHDALIMLACGGAIIWMLRGCLLWSFEPAVAVPWIWPAALLGVLAAGEGSYLLRTVRRWRPAWGVFAVVALAFSAAALASPPAIREYRASHVKPLLAYAQEHWFDIPSNARISVWRLPAEAPSGEHRDIVQVERRKRFSFTPTVQWFIAADHRSDGRWEFSPPRPIEGGPVEWPVGGCSVFADSAPVESADDARKLLQRVGVADVNLGRAQTTTRGEWDYYEFPCPRARGAYRVSKGPQLNIQLYLKQPLVVP